MYVEIDCSKYESLVQSQKDENPWSETNLYSNIALALFLGLDPEKQNNKWPVKGFCVKSSSSDTIYPELKEKIGGKVFDYYVLSVVDLKTKTVYLEGWCNYEDLTQEKNVYKNSYVITFKDLRPMMLLTKSE